MQISTSVPTPIYGVPRITKVPAPPSDSPASGSGPATSVTLSSKAQSAYGVRSFGVVWAPGMFDAADTDKSNGLNISEFATELGRVGVDADEAKKLFDSFDKSKDGTVSMDEFVDGVIADNATNTNSSFQSLALSYMSDDTTMKSFMTNESPTIDQYWNKVRAEG
ncbi:EF-hand domain-containing protein [Pseudomonas sp. NA-150]|uniref:EF-hand domain-containing protein n=1 Tax=Pseudomonas sp. NA-150 TaxID=3367525 RepID=UPI0037C6817E